MPTRPSDAMPSSGPAPDGSNGAAARQRSELWLPIIQPQRRRALWQMHQQLAAEWSQRMGDYLHHDDQFTFAGLGFETFGQLAERDCEGASSTVFTSEIGVITGLMLLNPQLTRYLVDRRLGARSEDQGETAAALTQLESHVLGRALDALLGNLSAVYAASGLGVLRPIHRGAQLRNMLLFTPDTYLIEFHYRVGEPQSPLALTVAAGVELISAAKDRPAFVGPVQSNDVRQIVASAPVNVEVVLGTWDATLNELMNLKPGDEVLLPSGSDSWLSAGGVRVNRVKVRLDHARVLLESWKDRNDGV